MCMQPVRFHSKMCLLSLVWKDKLPENFISCKFFFLHERRFDFFGRCFAVPKNYFTDPERTADLSLRTTDLDADLLGLANI